MFIFDDSTVARVPGEEAAAEQPWDAARDAEMTRAEAALKAGRPRRGDLTEAATSQLEGGEASPAAPQFREPAKFDQLPEELRPRFREIVRCEPGALAALPRIFFASSHHQETWRIAMRALKPTAARSFKASKQRQ